MDSLVLVDSSVWIRALRRNPTAAITQRLGELLAADAVATCGLIELELLGGTSNTTEFDRLRSRLAGLRRLPTEEDDWERAARLAFDLRRSGVIVPFTDVLLAALAKRHSATLLHADRDFDLVARHAGLVAESLVNILNP